MRHLAWIILVGTIGAVAADFPVQFIALSPDRDADQPAQIHLCCSADGWQAGGRPLERVAPGLYSATLKLPPGRLEYKFTRMGRWATVEKSATGQEIANRVVVVAPELTEQVIVHSIAAWADRQPAQGRRVRFAAPLADASVVGPSSRPAGQPESRPASTVTGDVRVHHDFTAPQFSRPRTLLVWLPPEYDRHPDVRYPAPYLQDGQNAFDAATSFAGVECQADETASRLIAAGKLRPLIMVAIYNTADRMNEYTPFRDERHGGGDGDKYVEFLTDSVKPFIDRTYRTRPGPADTAIVGSSLGGLISLYAANRRPDVFGAVAALSPSLFWADRALLAYAREHAAAPRPRLWIDIGTEEGRTVAGSIPTDHTTDCRALVSLLEQQGYRRDVDLHFEEIAGGQHHERDWAARFERVLLFLVTGEHPRP